MIIQLLVKTYNHPNSIGYHPPKSGYYPPKPAYTVHGLENEEQQSVSPTAFPSRPPSDRVGGTSF